MGFGGPGDGGTGRWQLTSDRGRAICQPDNSKLHQERQPSRRSPASARRAQSGPASLASPGTRSEDGLRHSRWPDTWDLESETCPVPQTQNLVVVGFGVGLSSRLSTCWGSKTVVPRQPARPQEDPHPTNLSTCPLTHRPLPSHTTKVPGGCLWVRSPLHRVCAQGSLRPKVALVALQCPHTRLCALAANPCWCFHPIASVDEPNPRLCAWAI